jgi:hypothetical protein
LSVEVEELKKRTCRLGKTLTVLGANTPGTMRICTEQRQQDFSMTYIQDEFSLLGQLHLVAYDMILVFSVALPTLFLVAHTECSPSESLR